MIKGASFKAGRGVAATTILILLTTTSLVFAATTYTPRWVIRPSPGGLVLEAATGVSGDPWGSTSNIFVTAYYVDTSTSPAQIKSVIIEYDQSGSLVDSAIIYDSSGTGNISLEGIALGPNYVYGAGYYESSTTITGVVVATDKASLGASLQYAFSNFYPSIYYGVCSGGDGSVYATGFYYNGTDYLMLVGSYTETLSPVLEATYSHASYNMTGFSCVIGPDGYLYVSGILFMRTGGVNYPVAVFVIKLDPLSLDIVSYRFIEAFNSQYYSIASAFTRNGVAASSSDIVLAASYTDELPDPTNPTPGAFVAILDTNLNIIARKNLTTSYYERFRTVAVGGGGEIVVAGQTNNDYATGLGTSVWHTIVLLMDSSLTVQRSILYGNDSYGSLPYSVGIDLDGYVYVAGYDAADTLLFYDITSDTVLQSRQPWLSKPTPRLPQLFGQEAVAKIAPPPLLSGVRKTSTLTAPSKEVESMPAISTLKLVLARRQLGVLATAGGGSSATLVALNDHVTPPLPPPQPVPEPWEVGLAALGSIIAYLAYRRTRRRKETGTGVPAS